MLLLLFSQAAVAPIVTGVSTGSTGNVYVNNPTGRPKRDLVKRAYALCGVADYEFGLSPEEVGAGVDELEAMMMQWPWNALGYASSEYGDGLPEEACGLESWAFPAVSSYLAVSLAPQIGKTLSREFMVQAARSMRSIEARVSTIPTMPYQSGTQRGAGARWQRSQGPFFPDASLPLDDEVTAGDLAAIAAGNG
jgi:P22 tail accessory factor